MARRPKRRKPGPATHDELLALFGELVAMLTRELAEKRCTPTLALVVREVLRDAGITSEVGNKAKQQAALALLGDTARIMSMPFAAGPLGSTDADAKGKKRRR